MGFGLALGLGLGLGLGFGGLGLGFGGFGFGFGFELGWPAVGKGGRQREAAGTVHRGWTYRERRALWEGVGMGVGSGLGSPGKG